MDTTLVWVVPDRSRPASVSPKTPLAVPVAVCGKLSYATL